MKRIVVGIAMLLGAVSGVAGAQGQSQPNTQCIDQVTEVEDACQKAVDLFDYMMPQLGSAMAGGNPTLGQGTTLGGFPHFQIGLRLTGVFGSVPKLDEPGVAPGTTGAQQTNYLTEDVPIPMPAVDLSIGILRDIPLPLVGGLDVLVSAAYVPSFEEEEIKLEVDSPLKIGFGARLALLNDVPALPTITISYLQRGLPTMDLLAVPQDDSIFINDFEVNTQSWRIIASKKLLFFTLALGAGQDTYDAETNVSAIVNEGAVRAAFGTEGGGAPFPFDQEVVRTNLFANIKLFGIAAEIGQVSGGDINTYNTYEAEPDKARLYASVGFRFGF